MSTLSLGTAVMALGDLRAVCPGSAGVGRHLEEIQPVECLAERHCGALQGGPRGGAGLGGGGGRGAGFLEGAV